jgi:hypothetical protein
MFVCLARIGGTAGAQGRSAAGGRPAVLPATAVLDLKRALRACYIGNGLGPYPSNSIGGRKQGLRTRALPGHRRLCQSNSTRSTVRGSPMRLAAVFTFVAIFLSVVPSHADKRVALVIGNGAYVSAPRLPNPRNDAEDVDAALKRSGFETIVGIDLDKAGMDDATIRFARAVRDADVALLYYSGHAMQFAGVNYLIPIDAKLTDEADLRRMTRVDEVVSDLQHARSVRILVLDSCRDNPLAEELKRSIGLSRAASMQRGLARIDTPLGMIVAFATQAGSTAADGSGRNSPYTGAFLSHIETPDEIGTVFRRVSTDVYEATKHTQLPELSISLIGEFYLRGAAPAKPTPAAPAIAAPATPPAAGDAERTWPFVKDTNSVAVLDDFIARYGDTIYAALARERRDELKKKEVANLSPPVQPAAPKDSAPKPALAPPEPQDAAPGLNLGRAWLGVQIQQVTNEFAATLGIRPPRGALIAWINDDAPAKRAGLQPGDVILKIDGKDINEMRDLPRVMADTPAGKEVDVVFVRNRREESRKIKVALRPPVPSAPGDVSECDLLAASRYDTTRPVGIAGIGISEIDAARAVPACRATLARRPNDPRTTFQLARALQRAGGPDADAEALHLYRSAADAGHTVAMIDLGHRYRDGRGVALDEVEAVRLYRKAAEAGDALGMADLGRMYEAGRGVSRDVAEAVRWYRKAADAGNEYAMESLRRLALVSPPQSGAAPVRSWYRNWYRRR